MLSSTWKQLDWFESLQPGPCAAMSWLHKNLLRQRMAFRYALIYTGHLIYSAEPLVDIMHACWPCTPAWMPNGMCA